MSNPSSTTRFDPVASDVMARLFQETAKHPARTPVQNLARSLGRTFHPCQVLVLWQASEAALQESGNRIPPRPANPQDIALFMQGLQPLGTPAVRADLLYERLSAAGGNIVGLSIRPNDSGNPDTETPNSRNLLLLLEPAVTADDLHGWRTRFEWFRRSVQDLQTLFHAFVGLSWAIEATRVSARIASLQAEARRSFNALIEGANTILRELRSWTRNDDGRPTLVLHILLAETVLLEVLGRGWDVTSQASEAATRDARLLVGELRKSGLSSNKELASVIDVLAAAVGEKPSVHEEPVAASSRTERLWLLATWTYVHQCARRALRARLDMRKSIEVEEEVRRICASSLPAIAEVLKHYGAGGRDGEDRKPIDQRFLAGWMRLWFCSRLMQDVVAPESSDDAKSILASARWRFYSDLAYVVRESLRSLLYGHHPHYFFQRPVLSAALRTLVEFHAIEILGLPRDFDLRGLLRDVGRISLGGGAVFATGHLQHALETYIVGHFLCELRVVASKEVSEVLSRRLGRGGDAFAGSPNGVELAQVLASGSTRLPGPTRRQQLLRAFSLAALFHDVGMVLFPYWTSRTESLGRVSSFVDHELSSVRDTLRESASSLLQECSRVLEEGGYIRANEEVRLVAWLSDVVVKGAPDHSVLGAWYLHRLCESPEQLPREVVNQAVRAVLLHSVVTQPIDPDLDPVAVLLVICDELMMWLEGHEPPQPDEFGRYFEAIAGDGRPPQSPFERISLSGLEIVLQKENRLSCILRLDRESALDSEGRLSWPRFLLDFRHPDHLPLSVHRLWLVMSQNLARIRRSALGFSPLFEARTRIPRRPGNLTTKELLERVAQRASIGLRPLLQQWLAHAQLADPDIEGRESLLIQPTDWIPREDLVAYGAEIEELVRAVIQEEDLRTNMLEPAVLEG